VLVVETTTDLGTQKRTFDYSKPYAPDRPPPIKLGWSSAFAVGLVRAVCRGDLAGEEIEGLRVELHRDNLNGVS